MTIERKDPAEPVRVGGAFLCLLAAIVMAYGWGYRGVVGHEGGAMVPGAMLGMAVCLASGRADWIRRSAVAGLFAAAGWAWGGSLSYMEHTLYSISDSWPDVVYGYAMLFLMGALWAGIGGAVLGLAFTLPRSRLEQFVGCFVAFSAVFLIIYLEFLFVPAHREAYELFTVQHFHDGEWLPAALILVTSAVYWIARPTDRPGTVLYVWGAAAWWIGYLACTKFGGIRIAPPFRSESWGGVIGILVVLIVFLMREKNRAALMLCMYGILGGGIAFALAVFIRHPVRVSWGPFATWEEKMQWKIAEESFGFFMGLFIALGVLRLLRGGLAPAAEDRPAKPLDLFAVFVMLVALMWVNLRRAPMDWIHRYQTAPTEPLLGMMPWLWYTIGGVLLTALALYALDLYRRDALVIAPATPYGKGALVLILLIWVTVIGAFVEHLTNPRGDNALLVDASFISLSVVATWMLLSGHRWARGQVPSAEAVAPPSDPRWKMGWGHALCWICAPPFILAISGVSMAMQDGPHEAARYRFGDNAYWRLQTQIPGAWIAVGQAQLINPRYLKRGPAPIQRIELRQDKTVALTLADGSIDTESHAWRTTNLFTMIDWYARDESDSRRSSVVVTYRENLLFIPWPLPDGGQNYVVFERAE